MSRLFSILRSYVLWSHERGSLHYDVMVTAILAFIFLAPYWVPFNDKPVERIPHQTQVVVIPDGQNGFIYQVDAAAVAGEGDAAVREGLHRVIEPIAGEIELLRYEPVHDRSGRLSIYRAWVRKL